MDVTGLRVSIDATGARQGEQQFNQSLDSMGQRARTVSQQIGDAFRPGENGLRSLSTTARTVSTEVAESFGTIRFGFRGLLDQVLNFRTLFESALAGISLEQVVEKISKVQDIKFALQAVTGSAETAGKAFAMLQADADRYGFQAEDLGDKFARLAMSTRGTALEGDRTVTVFRAAEIAARALGGGSEAAERALLSFTNILSSASIQGEQLIRQLARFGGIPDAMGIASRAFGKSVNDMITYLRSGALSSEEFVTKFTEQMVREMGPAADKSANSISAWKERVLGAFSDLANDMGRGGVGATVVQFLKDLDEQLSSTKFREAAEQLGGLLAGALKTLGAAIEFAGEHIGLLKAAIGGLIAFEVIDFVANFAKNILILGEAALKTAAAMRALTAAEATGAVGGIAGVALGAAAAFAEGGVMTSQGPTAPPGGAEASRGRITRERQSRIKEGLIYEPNVGFAMGGVMTSGGPLPLRRYADGGIATRPQVALFGEGSQPEAFIPLKDGQNVPVMMQMNMLRQSDASSMIPSIPVPSFSGAYVPLPDGRRIPAKIQIAEPFPIRRYAMGGIADSPQLAIFGDAGPEARIPLAQGNVPVQLGWTQNQNPAGFDWFSFATNLDQQNKRMNKMQDSIDVLQQNQKIVPASQPAPTFKPERTIGGVQGQPSEAEEEKKTGHRSAWVAAVASLVGPLVLGEVMQHFRPHLNAYLEGAGTEGGEHGMARRGAQRPKLDPDNPDDREKIYADEMRRARAAMRRENPKPTPFSPELRRELEIGSRGITGEGPADLTHGMGVRPQGIQAEPYANSSEMMEDVRRNRHLYFFQGGELPADHPLAAAEPRTGYTYNEMFRAVHDLYGHAAGGFQFGPKGEDAAYRMHARMFSPEAIPALTTEARGQNAWVNFGPHMRGATGELLKAGEPGYLPPPQRPFAEQKAGLLPSEFYAQPSTEPITPALPPRPMAIADAYSAMRHAPEEPAVKRSYDAMKRDLFEQWTRASREGMTFEPWQTHGMARRAQGEQLSWADMIPGAESFMSRPNVVPSPKEGEPWFHGRRGEQFFDQNRPAFFTREREGAEWYAHERGPMAAQPMIGEYALNMRNPARLRDLMGVVDKLGVGPKDIAAHSPYEGENTTDYLYVPKVRDALMKRGFDSYLGWDTLENRDIQIGVPFDNRAIARRSMSPVEEEVHGMAGRSRSEAARWAWDPTNPNGVRAALARKKAAAVSPADQIMMRIAAADAAERQREAAVVPPALETVVRPQGIEGPPKYPTTTLQRGYGGWVLPTAEYAPVDRYYGHYDKVSQLGYRGYEDAFDKGLVRVQMGHGYADLQARDYKKSKALLENIAGRIPASSAEQINLDAGGSYKWYEGEFLKRAEIAKRQRDAEQARKEEEQRRNVQMLNFFRGGNTYGMAERPQVTAFAEGGVMTSQGQRDLIAQAERAAEFMPSQGAATAYDPFYEKLRHVARGLEGRLGGGGGPTSEGVRERQGEVPQANKAVMDSWRNLFEYMAKQKDETRGMADRAMTGFQSAMHEEEFEPALRGDAAVKAAVQEMLRLQPHAPVTAEQGRDRMALRPQGIQTERSAYGRTSLADALQRMQTIRDLQEQGVMYSAADVIPFAEGGVMTAQGPRRLLPLYPQGDDEIHGMAARGALNTQLVREREWNKIRQRPGRMLGLGSEPDAGEQIEIDRAVEQYRKRRAAAQKAWVKIHGDMAAREEAAVAQAGQVAAAPTQLEKAATEHVATSQRATRLSEQGVPLNAVQGELFSRPRPAFVVPGAPPPSNLQSGVPIRWTGGPDTGHWVGVPAGAPPDQGLTERIAQEVFQKRGSAKLDDAFRQMEQKFVADKLIEARGPGAPKHPGMMASNELVEHEGTRAMAIMKRVDELAAQAKPNVPAPLTMGQLINEVVTKRPFHGEDLPDFRQKPFLEHDEMRDVVRRIIAARPQGVELPSTRLASDEMRLALEVEHAFSMAQSKPRPPAWDARRINELLAPPAPQPTSGVEVGYTGAQRKLFEMLGKRFAVAEPTLGEIVKFASPTLAKSPATFEPKFLGAGLENAAYDIGAERVLRAGYAEKETFPKDVPELVRPYSQEVLRAPIIQSQRPYAPHPLSGQIGKTQPIRMEIMPKMITADTPKGQAFDFDAEADEIKGRLQQRGLYWPDAHAGNVGMTPEGQFKIIDLGWMYRATQDKLGNRIKEQIAGPQGMHGIELANRADELDWVTSYKPRNEYGLHYMASRAATPQPEQTAPMGLFGPMIQNPVAEKTDDLTAVARRLQEFTQKKLRLTQLTTPDTSEEKLYQRALRMARPEFEAQMKAPQAAGIGFYEDMPRMHAEFAKLHPELQTNPKLAGFVTAITSAASLGRNSSMTVRALDQMYTAFKEQGTGLLPLTQPGGKPWGGYSRPVLENLNKVLESTGSPEAAYDFLTTKHRAKELEEIVGRPITGAQPETEVYGAFAMSPTTAPHKAGNFFLDMASASDPNLAASLAATEGGTLDRWMGRQWHRWMGTPLTGKGALQESLNPTEDRVMRRVLDTLAGESGIKRKQAQAVMWNFEQNLWKGAGADIEPQASYGKEMEEYVKEITDFPTFGFDEGAHGMAARGMGVTGFQSAMNAEEFEPELKGDAAVKAAVEEMLRLQPHAPVTRKRGIEEATHGMADRALTGFQSALGAEAFEPELRGDAAVKAAVEQMLMLQPNAPITRAQAAIRPQGIEVGGGARRLLDQIMQALPGVQPQPTTLPAGGGGFYDRLAKMRISDLGMHEDEDPRGLETLAKIIHLRDTPAPMRGIMHRNVERGPVSNPYEEANMQALFDEKYERQFAPTPKDRIRADVELEMHELEMMKRRQPPEGTHGMALREPGIQTDASQVSQQFMKAIDRIYGGALTDRMREQMAGFVAPYATQARYLAGGAESQVFDIAQDKVARFGAGAAPPFPNIPQVLQPIARTVIPARFEGDVMHGEIMPKVETRGITPDDLRIMRSKMDELGFKWDAKMDNLGRLAGELKIIDTGGMYQRQATPEREQELRRMQQNPFLAFEQNPDLATTVRPQGIQIAPTLGQEMFRAHRDLEGATFNPRTAQNLMGQPMWSVGIAPELTQVMKSMPQPQDFASFAEKNRTLFEHFTAAQLGSWHDLETGLHHLDIVGLTQSRERAMREAAQLGEKGIFNLGTKEYVPTGYESPRRPPLTQTMEQRFAELDEGTHGMAQRVSVRQLQALHDDIKMLPQRGIASQQQSETWMLGFVRTQQPMLKQLLEGLSGLSSLGPEAKTFVEHARASLTEAARIVEHPLGQDMSRAMYAQEIAFTKMHAALRFSGGSRYEREQGEDSADAWMSYFRSRGMGGRGVPVSPLEQNPAFDILVRRIEQATSALGQRPTESMIAGARALSQAGLSPQTARVVPLASAGVLPTGTLQAGRFGQYDDAQRQMLITVDKAGADSAGVIAHELTHALDLAARRAAPEMRGAIEREFDEMVQRARTAAMELFPQFAPQAQQYQRGARFDFLTEQQATQVAARAKAPSLYALESGDAAELIAEVNRLRTTGTRSERGIAAQYEQTNRYLNFAMGAQTAPMIGGRVVEPMFTSPAMERALSLSATTLGDRGLRPFINRPAMGAETPERAMATMQPGPTAMFLAQQAPKTTQVPEFEELAQAMRPNVGRFAVLGEHIGNLSMAAQMAAFPLMDIAPKTANMLFIMSNIGMMLPALQSIKPMIQDLAEAGVHGMAKRGVTPPQLEEFAERARQHSKAAMEGKEVVEEAKRVVPPQLAPFAEAAHMHSKAAEMRAAMETPAPVSRTNLPAEIISLMEKPVVPGGSFELPGGGVLKRPQLLLAGEVEKEAPKVVGLFEFLGSTLREKWSGAVNAVIGTIRAVPTAASRMWDGVVSGAAQAAEGIVARLQGGFSRAWSAVKAGWQGLVNLMGTEIDSKLGRKISVGLANMVGLNKGAGGLAEKVVGGGGGGMPPPIPPPINPEEVEEVAAMSGGLETATANTGLLATAASLLLNPFVLIAGAVAGIGIALYAVRDKQVTLNGEAYKMSDIYRGVWIGIKGVAIEAWDGIKNAASSFFDWVDKRTASWSQGGLISQLKSITLGDVAEAAGGKWLRDKLAETAAAGKDERRKDFIEGLQKANILSDYGPGGTITPEIMKEMATPFTFEKVSDDELTKMGKGRQEIAAIHDEYRKLQPFQGMSLFQMFEKGFDKTQVTEAFDILDRLKQQTQKESFGTNDIPFRQPEMWDQVLRELQTKASLAGPAAVGAMYGADEVERFKEVAEAERMIAEWRQKGMDEKTIQQVREYYSIIAEGNNALKINSELQKERQKALATPTFGRTPTVEYVDRSTFGGVNPEDVYAARIETARRGLSEPMNLASVQALGRGLVGEKLNIQQYNEVVKEATATFQQFMAQHTQAFELKPLGFDNVVDAINHGSFAYKEYMTLEQEEAKNVETFKDKSRALVEAFNQEAEANYRRAAALKFYASLREEGEKAEFERPLTQRMVAAQGQGEAAVERETAQQKLEQQLFDQTGARNLQEFQRMYKDFVNTPGMVPNLSQGIMPPGTLPEPHEQKGPIGSPNDPFWVRIAGDATQMEIMTQVQKQAELQGVPVGLALAVAQQESGFKQFKDGKVLTSSKGAEGVMQLMPETAKSLGVDPTDTYQNIFGGIKYLRQLFDYFGDWTKTIAAYNFGPGNVEKGLTYPEETRNYVSNVTRTANIITAGSLPTPATPPPPTSDVITPKAAELVQERELNSIVGVVSKLPLTVRQQPQLGMPDTASVTATAPEVPLVDMSKNVPTQVAERAVLDYFRIIMEYAAKKVAEDAADMHQKAVNAVVDQLRTLDVSQILQHYEDQITKINEAVKQHPELWSAAKIAVREATDSMGQAIDDLNMKSKTFTGGLKAGFDEFARSAQDMAVVGKKAADDFSGGLTKVLTDITTGNISKKGIGDMFKEQIGKPLMNDIVEGQIKHFITGPISGLLAQIIPGYQPPGEKPDGSLNKPFYVIAKSASGSAAGAAQGAAGGILGSLAGIIPGLGTIAGGGAAAGAAAGAGGILGGIMGAATGEAKGTPPFVAPHVIGGTTVTTATVQPGHSGGGQGGGWLQFLANPFGKASNSIGNLFSKLMPTPYNGPLGGGEESVAGMSVSDFFRPGAISQAVGGPASVPLISASPTSDTLDGFLASGGPVLAGHNYMVGERGPEIFTATTPGFVHARAFDTGGTMSSKGSTGGHGLPMSAITGAGNSGGPIGVIDDPITHKPRWTTFSSLIQTRPNGGFGPPAGAILQRHGDTRSFWDSFLPLMFMFLSNLKMAAGLMGGGGLFANVGDAPFEAGGSMPGYVPSADLVPPDMGSIFGGGANFSSMPAMPDFGSAPMPVLHAKGGIMTPFGPATLNMYDSGGIATSPQVAIFGEGRMAEAYVPLPDGRAIPVNVRGDRESGTQRGGSSTYRTEVHIHGVQDADSFRRSRNQIISSVTEAQSAQIRRRKP